MRLASVGVRVRGIDRESQRLACPTPQNRASGSDSPMMPWCGEDRFGAFEARLWPSTKNATKNATKKTT